MNTDAAWRKWGASDPYYAVLSTEKYRSGQDRDDFFASGRAHFGSIRARFEALDLPLDPSGGAVDFGCGVGRVLAPMSEYFDHSIGIDVVPEMLAEARKHVQGNTKLALLHQDALEHTLTPSAYEFVHTALVLQHITPKRGLRLLGGLCDAVAPGGKLIIQLPVDSANPLRHGASQALKANPVFCKLGRALLRRKRPFEPVMQMYVYHVRHLLPLWQKYGLEVRWLGAGIDGDVWQASWYLHKTP